MVLSAVHTVLAGLYFYADQFTTYFFIVDTYCGEFLSTWENVSSTPQPCTSYCNTGGGSCTGCMNTVNFDLVCISLFSAGINSCTNNVMQFSVCRSLDNLEYGSRLNKTSR